MPSRPRVVDGRARRAAPVARKRSEGECSTSGPPRAVGAAPSAQALGRGRRLRRAVASDSSARGERRGRVALLPAHAVAADLVEREAGVEGHGLGDQRGHHRRADSAPVPAPSALAQLGEHAPAGAHLARVAERLAHPLEAPVRVRDGALLLGVDSAGKTTSACSSSASSWKRGEGDHRARRAAELGARAGVGLEQQAARPRGQSATRRAAVGVGEARPERRAGSRPRAGRARSSRRGSRSGRTPACPAMPSAPATASSASTGLRAALAARARARPR